MSCTGRPGVWARGWVAQRWLLREKQRPLIVRSRHFKRRFPPDYVARGSFLIVTGMACAILSDSCDFLRRHPLPSPGRDYALIPSPGQNRQRRQRFSGRPAGKCAIEPRSSIITSKATPQRRSHMLSMAGSWPEAPIELCGMRWRQPPGRCKEESMSKSAHQIVMVLLASLTIALAGNSLVTGVRNALYGPAVIPDTPSLDRNLAIHGRAGAWIGPPSAMDLPQS